MTSLIDNLNAIAEKAKEDKNVNLAKEKEEKIINFKRELAIADNEALEYLKTGLALKIVDSAKNGFKKVDISTISYTLERNAKEDLNRTKIIYNKKFRLFDMLKERNDDITLLQKLELEIMSPEFAIEIKNELQLKSESSESSKEVDSKKADVFTCHCSTYTRPNFKTRHPDTIIYVSWETQEEERIRKENYDNKRRQYNRSKSSHNR
jgi:hypothetical protein